MFNEVTMVRQAYELAYNWVDSLNNVKRITPKRRTSDKNANFR